MNFTNLMNKKAQMGSAIIWFYKILMLILIVGGIVFLVISHFSGKYDVRDIEATTLSGKVISCFSDKGKLILEDFSKTTLDSCLNINEDEVFVNVSLNKDRSILIGKEIIFDYCIMKEGGSKGKNLPVCSKQEYQVLIDDEIEIVEVYIGILKLSKNT